MSLLSDQVKNRGRVMGYDVSIGDYESGYTSNTCDLIYNNLKGGLPSLNGLTGEQAAAKLSKCLVSIDKEALLMWTHERGTNYSWRSMTRQITGEVQRGQFCF